MTVKKCLLILASVSVIAACATAAWSSPTTGPNNLTTGSTGTRLLVSSSADRSNARNLQGANVSGEVAIFAGRASRVRSVAFYLDDPKMLTRPRQVDYYWPFDFAGTASGGTAELFDTSTLTAGRHVVTAKAVLTGGAKIVASAAFDKGETASSPTTTASTTTAPTTTAPTAIDLPSASTSTTQPAPGSPAPTATRETSTATTQPTTSSSPTPKATASSSAGFPDGSNTGVPAGINLTVVSGDMTITKAGTVVDGKDIRGCVSVRAAGVLIRNSKITCPRSYVVSSFADSYTGTGLLIEDSEVSCGNGPGTALGDTNITARRVNVHGCENGADVDINFTLEDSYVHDLWAENDAHADGVQLPIGNDVTIRHNRIEAGLQGTSAIISPSTGTRNVIIDNNLMSGGAATLYCRAKGAGTNYQVTNNRFSRKFYPLSGAYMPWTECEDEAVVTGNVWDDTGQPLPGSR
jgi:hypothetical protein